MINQNHIAAVYVTYNPNLEILDKSLKSVAHQVGLVIVVDNSDNDSCKQFFKTHPAITVEFVNCGGNKGIASALNRGYRLAYKLGYNWVLSMDQDSILAPNTVPEYLKYLNSSALLIGALVPAVILCENSKRVVGSDFEEVHDYMTSGSLVSLNAYSKTTGFEDDWFIDMVDVDFGIQLIKEGYKIIRIPSVVMQHNLGNATDITIFGRHLFYVTHHNYLRRYYITRNLLYLDHKHPGNEVYPNPYVTICKSVLRILFGEKDKLNKLKSIIKGIKDYKASIYGKYQN